MTDVSIWVAAISAGAAILGAATASSVQTLSIVRQQRREVQEIARTALDSQRMQDAAGSRQAEIMMQAATEFADSTHRLASISDEFLSRMAGVLERPANVASGPVRQDFDRPKGPSEKSDIDGAQVIRELAHSLGTPLAQIKAESLRLAAISLGQEEDFEKIAASVDLCNAFIGSFREIARISGRSSALSFVSLSRAIKTAADVYMSGDKKHIFLHIDVPEAIEGYSNTYLVSILAPLVENAIEASLEGDVIELSCVPEGESVVFRITNNYTDNPPNSESFAPGTSTKQGHEGMGLAMVKRLVESRRNGSVDCTIDGNRATFFINIPMRHK